MLLLRIAAGLQGQSCPTPVTPEPVVTIDRIPARAEPVIACRAIPLQVFA
ncbi:hypothetical protein MM2B1231_1050 [Mycobacteroides abscessus subsp. bolletii 2B-1231]|nr:hypothetical protein MM2B0912R_1390 [Mycobacteroides abscessus subsp. bolletii 2B-0912-R]EIV27297.1 hypothetical protein MM2B0912S_0990 [Mycobacteroides abscessus subsp. bolletii 2B-0912-S]EIV80282.1 hypothetical protein MM2B1231_1050 [Mycobacteroides abscessus subsp. bolletii 2B-1231]EIV80933.1 hypothetical protein MM2B0107_0326 [Mycobacteroides abscessus subsp. bolletii 2B-0107]